MQPDHSLSQHALQLITTRTLAAMHQYLFTCPFPALPKFFFQQPRRDCPGQGDYHKLRKTFGHRQTARAENAEDGNVGPRSWPRSQWPLEGRNKEEQREEWWQWQWQSWRWQTQPWPWWPGPWRPGPWPWPRLIKRGTRGLTAGLVRPRFCLISHLILADPGLGKKHKHAKQTPCTAVQAARWVDWQ